MVERILARLGRRFVFVVGKGGVGKSTTAGALALALADRGHSTHLISTDPAHSVSDLFGIDPDPGSPLPSPCSDRLVLEELDATAYTRAWVERGRAPVLELFDRGTYLDMEDLEPFLDLTLPGVDEVAGILRLAELARGDTERIVVDTAPTGHALRLLDSGAIVDSWVRAFDAMGAKAAAVLHGLTRSTVRLEGQAFVAELEEEVRRFRELVVSDADAVVVERSGSVVAAETRRLMAALNQRGLPVAVRVRTLAADERAPSDDDSPADPASDIGQTIPTETAPYRTDLQGCDALRHWGRPSDPEDVARPPARPPGDAAAFLRELSPSLLLFVGKGGVGKSTCAAAAALALAERGPVTLLSTDPAGSLDDVLGTEKFGDLDLRVRQVEASERFERVRERYRDDVEEAFQRLGLDRSAALDRRVLASLLDLAPPGVDEVFALVTLLEDVDQGRTVVVDSAPTGHLVRLLALPSLGLAWTRQLMRILLKYRSILGLDAFAERLLDFAKRLKALNLELEDPERAAAVVVTQPGPLVQAETARLMGALDEAGISVAATIQNRAPSSAWDSEPAPDGRPTRILAPDRTEPPVGPAALNDFLSSWSVDR